MAQINEDSANHSESTDLKSLLWSASHLLTIGLVSRFFRNYNRYKETTYSHPDKIVLKQLCRQISHKLHAYRGILSASESSESPHYQTAGLLIQQQLHDAYEDLHHRLLYLDAELIADIIPLIDEQMRFWKPQTTESEDDSLAISSTGLHETEQRAAEIESFIHNLEY